MPIKNSDNVYGWVAIALHWLVAIVVIGLFALGLWMTDLTYYDDWYKQAPFIHKSIGILLFGTMIFRLIWRWTNTEPQAEPSLTRIERLGSSAAHWALYGLLFAIMISGYLISTADGNSISVFGWLEVPATLMKEHQEDIAGDVHFWLAWTVIVLASLHALAALKHHFWDGDATLKKMLGRASETPKKPH